MADELTGLLGGVINPDDLKRIMAMFQPTEDDKSAALKQALMTSGLRMLAARKGFEGVAAADAGLMGLQAYQQGMSGVQDAKLKQYKIGSEFQKMAGDQKYSAGLAQQFNGNPALQAMGPGGPTQANADAVAAVNPKVAQYRNAAQFAAKNGRVKEAETLSQIADRMESEYSTTPQTVRGADGKMQLVQFGKRGETKVAQGMVPAAPLHFAATGKMAGVGLDPFTGDQVSAGLPVSMDPAQEDNSKRSWAQYQLNKNADDRAARESTNPQLLGGKANFEAENKIRDEYTKATAPYVVVRDAHQRIQAAAKDPSAAGDMAVIFSYMKVLDPGSTVREGEYATAQNAGSIPDRVRAQYNAVMNGEKLSDKMRNDFVSRSTKLYKSAENSHLRDQQQYKGLATQYGLKPENVVRDLRPQQQEQGAKTVVRTGKEKGTGRTVIQYSDGTIGYQ